MQIKKPFFGLLAGLLCAWAAGSLAQSIGGAGTVSGTVTDPAGALVAGATVVIQSSVTGYKRTATTDATGAFRFGDVPPNNYQLTASANGFNSASQNLAVRTAVPISVDITLTVGEVSNSVTVEGSANNVENIPTSHTDVDQSLIARLPVRSVGSGLSEVVTAAAPGVVADSNGNFHPLGDHAQSTISLDNQPISDQSSKAFSTQPPVNAIQSLEVITGATPAEYGDKTSLVISAITRSGLGQKKPTGSVSEQYGSFGGSTTEATIGFGKEKVGNFVAFNFEHSGRFLDAPEFSILHDSGEASSVFDHFDYNPNSKDSLHLNLLLARNSFQIPNTYDQQALGQDQRQLVRSLNVAPGYVHIFNPTTVLTINPYYRLDQVWYYPSANPFSDQTTTLSQQRRLTNAGLRADIAYTKGKHNAKFGVQTSHTFLTEAFQFGITDPNFNDPARGDFLLGLLPYDLTRGGRLFNFNGHTDIKQVAAFAQDAITFGALTLSAGVRFDNYAGISKDHLWQPRLGLSYHLKSNTVLRASYSRSLETPYNENLILSSATGGGGLADGILGNTTTQPLKPGRRHQFNTGFQQGFGKHIVIDVDYFWKRTHNAYDFSVLLNTPIAFPISWKLAKIDGVSARVNFSDYKGFTAFFVAGHTRARYFPPESGGLFFNSDLPEGVFRIDHDQAFQQTTQAQYQFHRLKKVEPYISLSWRYDSGSVAGALPDYAAALALTPDQQAQVGLFCGGAFATPLRGLTSCADPNRGATRARIPADGTENDDFNPPRIAARHLFDLSAGTDNLLRTEHKRMTLRFTAINLTNKVALYNFLSTFSGTHFVSPRAFTAQVGLVF
jgi:outer membrane receptor protein involved in Fe transport